MINKCVVGAGDGGGGVERNGIMILCTQKKKNVKPLTHVTALLSESE